MRAGVAVENARVHGVRTHIATTLQRSLLPPRLPAVPGMTIAARFRAAGEATEVGGDFYDLFAVDGSWMVVMGDVTGKGPEAAAITSLARYTMRTAAVYEASPSGVLERLNAALVVDPDRRQICTVVAARIVAGADGSAEITVACGGPPRAVPPARRPRRARRGGRPAARRLREPAAGPRPWCGSGRARASSSTPTASPTRAAPTGRVRRPSAWRTSWPRRAASSRTRSPTASTSALRRLRGGPAARRRRAARPAGVRRARRGGVARRRRIRPVRRRLGTPGRKRPDDAGTSRRGIDGPGGPGCHPPRTRWKSGPPST